MSAHVETPAALVRSALWLRLARSRGLIVVTGNRGEFDRVEGLRCEDWG